MSRFLIAAACILACACGSPESRDDFDSMATESTSPATSVPGDVVEEPATVVETPLPPSELPPATTAAPETGIEEAPTPPLGGETETSATATESAPQSPAPVEPPS